MKFSKEILFMCLCVIFISAYCVEQSSGRTFVKTIKDISPEQWKQLSEQKIYFGHQSVGNNIINGIQLIMEEHPEIKLNIIETRDLPSVDGGAFYHSKVGENENPASKTKDFVSIIESGIGEKADIAFHKYCYIDVNADTDVEKMFQNYKEKIDALKLRYPEVKFVHITSPLTTIQTGPKAWVKKILGRPISGIVPNIKRNMFNQQLLDTYQNIDPVFDLALAEATQPDGTVTTFERDGKKYLTLYKKYSSDGGHLNEQGQKKIAEQLLLFLIENL